ncbi:unnamed protein product [Xylocopa violacea]|uniref:Uncharacterized protein n=1 Tax=Xylocopa violacea TaxID=135666 RepID=A0ABP1NF66_XYLVO
MVFACAATRKEDLERAAELAVEKAAERAAERAVEKALESGNMTTESKTVRESYSSVRKVPYSEDSATYVGRSSPVENKSEPENDFGDWIEPAGWFRSNSFKGWTSRIGSGGWRRVPRSYDSGVSWQRVPYLVDVLANVPVEKKVPYEVKMERPVPYKVEAKASISQPCIVDKAVFYEVKVPVKVPEP